eukprot:TRINITY_DN12314_c0_g1_i1.p1 TRINITY_DN12314_c0_g1~~TRINITY_DN12314_c0_g1_i1.p1  ORF type:complete len:495 (-),score=106.37 TRINITY_DN12314_c0_g1_i1:169-1653(-)
MKRTTQENPTTVKRRKMSEKKPTITQNETVLAQFVTPDGEATGPKLALPVSIDHTDLHTLINDHILQNQEKLPYSFFAHDEEITSNQSVFSILLSQDEVNPEEVLQIVYVPQAIFRVRSITRCTSSLPGHTEAILDVSFSPDGLLLATASGDTTIRLWETSTCTPYKECKGHSNWVLCVVWSPDGRKLASGSMDKTIRIWDPTTGEQLQRYTGHRECITSISWEPLHQNAEGNRFVSASRDGTARVWDATKRLCVRSLGAHTESITCVKWGGEGLIYTASQDTTIKVWSANEGKLVRVLKGHGHWVNTLSLNTDYVLRTGAYDHTGVSYDNPIEAQEKALERYNAVKGPGPEKLVSGSDDHTCYLWEPSVSKQPLTRMTGHGKLINIVSFSPDGNYIASASFDKNIKLWASNGRYVTTFRGHVGEVYQLSWSADSRMFVTGSKDSTLKVWDIRHKKLREDLPGHADEVYSVDWGPDGGFVASGSKDKLLKLWRN